LTELPAETWTIVFFLVGLAVGSFLNVCIFRLPHSESVIAPRSRCGYCRTRLAWFENIPILSFIVLRGRCRYCAHYLSPQYVIVELATALMFAAVYRHTLDLRTAGALCLFASLLIVA